jgi:RNA polymerase sigma-70 factor (ECF subfamily)
MAAGQLSRDDDLLRRVAAGDEWAFTALYHGYQKLVYRFAMQMSGSATIAEEATQEVFLALMRQAAEFDPSRGRLSSWLYGIARNQVLRQLDRRSGWVGLDSGHQGEELDLPPELPPELIATFDPIEAMTQQEQSGALRRAIVSLPPHYREAVVLCDLHEMSYAEAAVVAGCAVGTIRSRLHRARALLHGKLAARRPAAACAKAPQGR